MKKYLLILTIIGVALLQAKCDSNLKKLVMAYKQIKACKNNQIIWSDGAIMRYDDGDRETFEKILKNADIEDMFTHSYAKAPYSSPLHNHDAGRYRNDKFFRKMYGSNPSKVKRNLTLISWLGQKIKVTTVNRVDRQLKKIEKDLKRLLKQKPSYRKYLTPIGGTYKWRKIAGTNRLSVHSFGAAIDIRVKYSAYWRWSKGAYRYQNKIPLEIVKIFEKHGFIWGGKWYHYDTMHFEYRPELLL